MSKQVAWYFSPGVVIRNTSVINGLWKVAIEEGVMKCIYTGRTLPYLTFSPSHTDLLEEVHKNHGDYNLTYEKALELAQEYPFDWVKED